MKYAIKLRYSGSPVLWMGPSGVGLGGRAWCIERDISKRHLTEARAAAHAQCKLMNIRLKATPTHRYVVVRIPDPKPTQYAIKRVNGLSYDTSNGRVWMGNPMVHSSCYRES